MNPAPPTSPSSLHPTLPSPHLSEALPPVNATKKHIRGSSLLLIGRVISLALNFGVQVLTVRYLSKGDYGAFAYALSIVSMGASVALFGLDKAIARFVPIYQEREEYPKMFGTILMTVTAVVGVGMALVLSIFGLPGLLARYVISDPLSLSLLLIVITLSPVQALDSWFQGMFAVFARPRAIFFRRHLLGPGLKLLVVLLVMATRSQVRWLAVGYLVGGILGISTYVTMLWQLLHQQGLWQHFRLKGAQWPVREVFGFSVPLLTTDVLLILKSSMVVVLLEYFRNPVAVAEYRAVLPVAGLNAVVMQSFKYLFTPLAARLFARHDKAGINTLYWQTAVWIALISFPVFAITFSLARPLTILLFEERYAQSATLLALLTLGEYFNAALGFNAYTLRVYGKVRYIVTIDLLSAVMSLGLSLWLIPRYGALGAAVASCAVLVAYNLLNHTGLLLGTGVDLFQWRYLKVYVYISLAALVLWLAQVALDPPIYISLTLVAFISLLLLRLNRKVLKVGQMFPELRRIPLLRPFLGLEMKSEQ